MVRGKITSHIRKGSYGIGSSILASTSDSMPVCNLMSAPIGKDTVGDESLESIDELFEGYLSSIDSIASKGIGWIGRGAMRESSVWWMMEEAIRVRSIDESLSIGRINGLWRRYPNWLMVLTRNESWSSLERERSWCGRKRSRIGGRKQIRTTMICAIQMYAMISTEYTVTQKPFPYSPQRWCTQRTTKHRGNRA